MGHNSTTQYLVVPHPGNKRQFYFFTPGSVDGGQPTTGLRYSLIDMSLNGGLGDVVAGIKTFAIEL